MNDCNLYNVIFVVSTNLEFYYIPYLALSGYIIEASGIAPQSQ